MLVDEIPGLQRPIPVPTDMTKPFWDAANEQKLVIQHCNACGALVYPMRARCNRCSDAGPLGWKEVEGKAHIDVHLVIRDSRIRGFRSAQPINFAIIRLDEDPGINFLSNLPGTPAGEFKDDTPVELCFVKAAGSEQLIPEWRIA
jgi:hypothetical protein